MAHWTFSTQGEVGIHPRASKFQIEFLGLGRQPMNDLHFPLNKSCQIRPSQGFQFRQFEV
jgi:hypothetical protein